MIYTIKISSFEKKWYADDEGLKKIFPVIKEEDVKFNDYVKTAVEHIEKAKEATRKVEDKNDYLKEARRLLINAMDAIGRGVK